MMVNINIDTHWRGNPDAEPIDVTESPDEPPESEEEPPRVVIIGRELRFGAAGARRGQGHSLHRGSSGRGADLGPPQAEQPESNAIRIHPA